MDLDIEDIPRELMRKLEAQAARNSRTLEDEVLAILLAATKTEEPSRQPSLKTESAKVKTED